MYETLLSRLDSIAGVLGLRSEEAEVRKGINPWGYAGGSIAQLPNEIKEEEERKGSFEAMKTDDSRENEGETWLEKGEL